MANKLNDCWACRQHKCNRCIGCGCTHEKTQYEKAEKIEEEDVLGSLIKMFTPKRPRK